MLDRAPVSYVEDRKVMTEWNQILQRKEYSPESPDETVVNLASILKERKAKRILDLGCGAGRHVTYPAGRGFESHGSDISETGLKLTKKKLKNRKLEAEIIKCDMKLTPYIDSYFGAALLLANFHSKRSSKHGKGIKIEEDTFIQQKGAEKGVLHHFVDENELHKLLANFKIVALETGEKMTGSYLRNLFIVLAEKV